MLRAWNGTPNSSYMAVLTRVRKLNPSPVSKWPYRADVPDRNSFALHVFSHFGQVRARWLNSAAQAGPSFEKKKKKKTSSVER